MIGTILKLVVAIVIVLIGLQIFAPEVYEDATNQLSQSTGVDKNIIDENIDKAKDLASDGIDEVKNQLDK